MKRLIFIVSMFCTPALAQSIDLTQYTQTFYAPFSSLSNITDCQGKTPCYFTPGTYWISAIPNGFGPKDYSALSVGGALGPGLHITATHDPVTGKWHSGEVSSCDNSTNPLKGFRQGGGYFEATIKQPNSQGTPKTGNGMWSSFWMTTAGEPFPPGHELDVFEDYGFGGPWGFHTTWHKTTSAGVYSAAGIRVTTPLDLSAAYHTYGIDIQSSAPGQNGLTTWYLDRQQVFQVATAPEFLIPQCIYLDYALGGNFPVTDVLNGTHMDILKVTAYKHK